jgi:hypothetical protein
LAVAVQAARVTQETTAVAVEVLVDIEKEHLLI